MLLLWRRLRSLIILIVVVLIEQALERLYKLSLLLFHICLVRVTREVDVFSFTALLGSALGRRLLRNEGLFLVKLVEAGAVLLVLDIRNVGRLLASYLVPVESLEKRMIFDLVNATGSKSIIYVAE